MSRPSTSDRLLEIHRSALAEFDRIQSAMHEERQMCVEDRRFYSIAGAQWEGNLGEQFENKPKFEVNKVHLAVLRIINEYRNNRIAVAFVSKDGTANDRMTDICAGLFRADEYDSGAEEAYDNAFEEAVGGGFGALRLRTSYENDEDPDDERQRVRIEPIFDADSSVFFDLDAKRQDKADAKHCFVVYSMTPEAYEEEYGDTPASWNKDVGSTQFDWSAPDVVFLAEYYRVETEKDEIITLVGVAGDERKLIDSETSPDTMDELLGSGYTEVRRRKIRTRRVHKYLLSGGGILDDLGMIAGKNIPIIPVYGKRWYIDNIERCMGHVRLAKDAQRLKNMQLSKLGELSALSSAEKPIFVPEQVAGHQMMWTDDNLKNYPYLLLNPVTGSDGSVMPAGPIGYTKPPAVPQAMAALLQLTEVDMREILGSQQDTDKLVSHVSSKAIELVHNHMDMQTYIYVSNFAKAVRRVGEVWLSIAREVYVEDGRKMKVLDPSDNSASTVTLLAPRKDPATGALAAEADLAAADFDVAVDVGPSSSSLRAATVRSLTEMLQITQDPETASVLQAMTIMNMEGEGIADVREFFRKKLVKMGAMEPNDEEAKAMAAAAAEPDPQKEALLAMAEEANAKATKARADVLQTMADVELTHAKTVETLANVDMDSTRAAIEGVERMFKPGQKP